MPDFLLPTLALSAGEIVSILIAIGVILSGIFGQANEAKKAKEKREARRRGESVGGEQVSAGGLDEIAQRRRQQLEALARQRRGGGTSVSTQPTNMTTTQTIERAAAKAQYEEREAGKREHEKVNPMLAWGESGGTAQAGADAARAEMNATRAAKQNEGARRGADQRLRGKQQAKAQRQAQREAQRQAQLAEQARTSRVVVEENEPRRKPLSEDGRGTPQAAAFEHQSAYETEAVDRSVPDNVTGPGVERKSKLVDIMKGRSWRDVILMKEILDPPRSMRE